MNFISYMNISKVLQRVLTSSEFKEKGYRRVTLIKKDFSANVSRVERHDSWYSLLTFYFFLYCYHLLSHSHSRILSLTVEFRVQRSRRTVLARARNHLIFSVLENEKYILWIDSDIINVPHGILHQMIASGKDIVTPRYA